MSEKIKNIVIVVVLLVVVFIGYSFFFKKDDGGVLVSKGVVGGAGGGAAGEFLVLLQRLHDLTLDTSIFSDPIFNSLRDESTELIPQTRGRKNPFAPL